MSSNSDQTRQSTTTTTTSDPFQLHADLYAIARPTYPLQVIEKIVSSLDPSNGGRHLAVDVGAGSGQLTFALAHYFDKVLGIDKSIAQLEQRKEHQSRRHNPADGGDETIQGKKFNVDFQQGLATDLAKIMTSSSSSSSRADLVTCAQMYHWLVADGTAHEFLQQVQSILQPTTGRLAMLGYSVPSIVSSSALQEIFEEYYVDTLKSRQDPKTTPGYMWPIDRRLVDSQYASLDFPGFTVLERCTMTELKTIPVSIFIAYMKSMSAYQTLMQQQQQNAATTDSRITSSLQDPMERVQQRMYEIASSPDELIQVQYPFFLILLQPNSGV
jgi:SAM-dependent methyltransferase